MTDIVTLWHGEHGKFTRLLDQLESRVARFAEGDDDQVGVVSDIVAYLHHYGERAHHRREDIGFVRLASIDSTFEPIVMDLQREHAAIIEAGRLLVEQLDALASGSTIIARDAVVARTRDYLELQRSHLAREDNEIIPRIAERFGEQDWRAVQEAITERVDTRLPPHLLPRFQALSHQIAVELATS